MQPWVQLLLYWFAGGSVQSFNTHTSQGQIPVRPTQSSDGCAAETPMGKSRAMRGKGAQAMFQRCLMGNKAGNCRLGLKFS